MGIVGFSFAMDRFAGFPGRYADLAERYGDNAFDPDLMAEKSMSILDQLAENETIADGTLANALNMVLRTFGIRTLRRRTCF